MIKAIIFDCFGVLTTDAWLEFINSLPPTADTKKAHELNHQYGAGMLTTEDFLDQVEVVVGRRPESIKDEFGQETAKNRALINYIRELKRDFKIGLLSNVATPWITDTFLTPDEQKLFDAMVLSFEVGVTKPDPKIFKLVCEKLGVNTEEAILVDDIERYCEAARQVGMKAVVYKDLHQLKKELTKLLNHQ